MTIKGGLIADGSTSLPEAPRRGRAIQLSLGLEEPEAQKVDPMEGVRGAGGKKQKRTEKEKSDRKGKDPAFLSYYAPSEMVKTLAGQILLVTGHLAGWTIVRVMRDGKIGRLLIVDDRRVESAGRFYGCARLVKGW